MNKNLKLKITGTAIKNLMKSKTLESIHNIKLNQRGFNIDIAIVSWPEENSIGFCIADKKGQNGNLDNFSNLYDYKNAYELEELGVTHDWKHGIQYFTLEINKLNKKTLTEIKETFNKILIFVIDEIEETLSYYYDNY